MLLMRSIEDITTWGYWALFLLIGSFMEMARNGLIQNAKVKYMASAEEEDYRQILTSSTLINVVLTGLIALGLYFGSDYIASALNSPPLASLLKIYVVTAFVLIPFAQGNFVQQANFSFRGIMASTFVRQAIYLGFVIWVYIGQRNGKPVNLEQLAWFQCIAAGGGSLVAIWFARPFLRFAPLFSGNWSGTLLRFGAFTFGTSLSSYLYKSIDRLMLGNMNGADDVAILDPAIRITEIMEIPIQAMAAIVYPQSARMIVEEGKEAVKGLYEKSVGAVLAMILPFCLSGLIFPGFYVWLLVGDNPAFAQSAVILQVTILYTLFVPFGRQFGTTLDSIGKPYWSFIFVISGAIMNIISNYLFIKEFGVIGAAYGTLLTLVLKFIAQQIILYKVLNVHTLRVFYYMFSFYKQVIPMLNEVRKGGLSALRKEASSKEENGAD